MVRAQSSWIFFALSVFMMLSTACTRRGCLDPDASNFDPTAQRDDKSCIYPNADDATKADFAEFYAATAHAMYQDAYLQAEQLLLAIELMLINPTQENLQACKDAWVLAHIPYSQAEALIYPGSPVALEENNRLESRINAWKFNPANIDYVQGNTQAGIIGDAELYPEITADLLISLNNTKGGDCITLGYHVIEFLLWGEDSDPVELLTQGNRSHTDYDVSDSTVYAAERRGSYLRTCTQQLLADLAMLANAWSPLGADNYLRTFEAYSPRKRTRLAVTGLVYFGQYELGRNRIKSSLLGTETQREESKFSDNTHRDIYFNVQGIKCFITGRYGRTDSTYVSGTSFYQVVAEHDSVQANELLTLLNKAEAASLKIPAPYDYQLEIEQVDGTGFITDQQAILEALGEKLRKISTELGMGIDNDLP